MLFNSLEFALFLPVVFICYWFITVHDLRLQNLLLLIASYFFYAWWDYRFLSLLAFSTILDYSLALRIQGADSISKEKHGCGPVLVSIWASSESLNISIFLFPPLPTHWNMWECRPIPFH
jgi:D-alanyl-lipoteichoic acid acyltransferase DltB (MBOAT superfamily)